MRRRQRISPDPSDLRQVILPLLSLAYASVILLNLTRLVIFHGSPVLLALWAPGTTPLGIGVISFLIVIASLWAVLLTSIAFGERYPSKVVGALLRTALIGLGILAIVHLMALRDGGWKAVRIVERVYDRYEGQDEGRVETFGDIKAVVDMLRSEGVRTKRSSH